MKFDSQSLSANQRYQEYRARREQGLTPNPGTDKIVEWLKLHRDSIQPLFNADLPVESAIYFDLSVANANDPADAKRFSAIINNLMLQHKASVGIGRYNENRWCYQSDVFQNKEIKQARTLHIGVDLFVPSETVLFAPLPATIHSFQNNGNLLDYGPTIILEHEIEANVSFFTLYGHLSIDSLNNLQPGKIFRAGEAFAKVGNYPENGNWPPHVHVQLISDMLNMQGDFPGVVTQAEAPLWLQLCPNPDLFLSLPKQNASNTFILSAP